MQLISRNKCSTFLLVDRSAKLSYVELDLGSKDLKRLSNSLERNSFQLLGELTVANILLSSSLKHKGSVMLQIHGKGKISLAVTECNFKGEFRSMVKENHKSYTKDKKDLYSFKKLVSPEDGGIFIATIKLPNNLKSAYQGIVQINDLGVDHSIEYYLNYSEQIKSWLRIFSEGKIFKGLLLQALPQKANQKKFNLDLMKFELEQIEAKQAINTNLENLILKKYQNQNLIRTKILSPTFRCKCDRKKIIETIQQFHNSGTLNKTAGEPFIEVVCEFCAKLFRINFDELNIDYDH